MNKRERKIIAEAIHLLYSDDDAGGDPNRGLEMLCELAGLPYTKPRDIKRASDRQIYEAIYGSRGAGNFGGASITVSLEPTKPDCGDGWYKFLGISRPPATKEDPA